MFTIIGEAVKHHLFSRFAVIILSRSVVTRARGQRRMSFRGSEAPEHEVGHASGGLKDPTRSALSSNRGLLMAFMRSHTPLNPSPLFKDSSGTSRTAEEECGD